MGSEIRFAITTGKVLQSNDLDIIGYNHVGAMAGLGQAFLFIH
jgi:hypothetical protein